jgi:hypothetical protein
MGVIVTRLYLRYQYFVRTGSEIIRVTILSSRSCTHYLEGSIYNRRTLEESGYVI